MDVLENIDASLANFNREATKIQFRVENLRRQLSSEESELIRVKKQLDAFMERRRQIEDRIKWINLHSVSMTIKPQADCAVCQTPLVPIWESHEVKLRSLPCGHVFHQEPCIDRWLLDHDTCPVCRAKNLQSINSTSEEFERRIDDADHIAEAPAEIYVGSGVRVSRAEFTAVVRRIRARWDAIARGDENVNF